MPIENHTHKRNTKIVWKKPTILSNIITIWSVIGIYQKNANFEAIVLGTPFQPFIVTEPSVKAKDEPKVNPNKEGDGLLPLIIKKSIGGTKRQKIASAIHEK
jgi:hypothetical protein